MKHKLKPVLVRHQLHYFIEFYEELSNREDRALIDASNIITLRKALSVINDYEKYHHE